MRKLIRLPLHQLTWLMIVWSIHQLGCTPNGPFVPGDEEVLFRDDFLNQLEVGWVLDGSNIDVSLRERADFLSLFPPKAIPAGMQTGRTALLREASDDFAIVALLEFQTTQDLQSSGLVIQGSDGRTVLLGMSRIDQVGFRGVLMLADRGPDVERGRALVRSELQTIFLRLERRGDRYTGSYSVDGVSFATIGTLNNDLSTDVSVGMGTLIASACTQNCELRVPAHFAYFEIRSIGP